MDNKSLLYIFSLLQDLEKYNKEVFKKLSELTWGKKALELGQKKLYVQINQLALTYAIGKDTEGKDAQIHKKTVNPLRSIFNIIDTKRSREDKTLKESVHYLPLSSLDLKKKTIFPNKQLPVSEQAIWDDFLDDIESMGEPEKPEILAETLYYLLKKHTSQLGAGIQPDTISFFELSKSKAAFAICIYDYIQEKQKVHEPFFEDEEEPFLMFCGDVSGIQKFIYNIYSRKASKSLKGRSFYIYLLTETILQYILEHPSIQLNLFNIIYASGGKFYLLLPNLAVVIQALDEIEKTIAANIFNQHREELYVNMDYISFGFHKKSSSIHSQSKNDKGEPISQLKDLWKALTDKTSQKKSLRYKSLFFQTYEVEEESGKQKDIGGFDAFFKDADAEIKEGINSDKYTNCAVTGRTVEKIPENILIGTSNEDGVVYVTPRANKQVKLGSVLKDSTYLTTSSEKFAVNKEYRKTYEVDEPLYLKVYQKLSEKFPQEDIQKSNALFRVKRINRLDFLDKSFKSKPQDIIQGFTFYGGEGDQRNFAELVGLEDNKENKNESSQKGFRRLGILRMDVDGLGKIFTHGLPSDHANFAAYATLSGQLDLFFSGYINTIRNEGVYRNSQDNKAKEYYQHWVNIIYSGGDDVFAVGRWDVLIDFAAKVREEFREFVGGREDISISAGIALVRVKFPIAKAADLAGDAEDDAKDFKRKEKSENGKEISTEKNAFALLGEVVSWKDEYPFVQDLAELIFKLLVNQVLSKGTVGKLFSFRANKNEWKEAEEKKVKNTNKKPKRKGQFDWWWLSAYYFAQAMRNTRDGSEEREILNQFKESLVTHRFNYEPPNGGKAVSHLAPSRERMLDLICLAAQIADYKFRNHQK